MQVRAVLIAVVTLFIPSCFECDVACVNRSEIHAVTADGEPLREFDATLIIDGERFEATACGSDGGKAYFDGPLGGELFCTEGTIKFDDDPRSLRLELSSEDGRFAGTVHMKRTEQSCPTCNDGYAEVVVE